MAWPSFPAPVLAPVVPPVAAAAPAVLIADGDRRGWPDGSWQAQLELSVAAAAVRDAATAASDALETCPRMLCAEVPGGVPVQATRPLRVGAAAPAVAVRNAAADPAGAVGAAALLRNGALMAVAGGAGERAGEVCKLRVEAVREIVLPDAVSAAAPRLMIHYEAPPPAGVDLSSSGGRGKKQSKGARPLNERGAVPASVCLDGLIICNDDRF